MGFINLMLSEFALVRKKLKLAGINIKKALGTYIKS